MNSTFILKKRNLHSLSAEVTKIFVLIHHIYYFLQNEEPCTLDQISKKLHLNTNKGIISNSNLSRANLIQAIPKKSNESLFSGIKRPIPRYNCCFVKPEPKFLKSKIQSASNFKIPAKPQERSQNLVDFQKGIVKKVLQAMAANADIHNPKSKLPNANHVKISSNQDRKQTPFRVSISQHSQHGQNTGIHAEMLKTKSLALEITNKALQQILLESHKLMINGQPIPCEMQKIIYFLNKKMSKNVDGKANNDIPRINVNFFIVD